MGDSSSRNVATTSSYVDDMVPSFKTVMRNNNLRRQLELYLVQQGESQVCFHLFPLTGCHLITNTLPRLAY